MEAFMYSANLTIDLESPYQNAARREERYQVIVESQQEDIFSALTDEQEAESFIRKTKVWNQADHDGRAV